MTDAIDVSDDDVPSDARSRALTAVVDQHQNRDFDSSALAERWLRLTLESEEMTD